MPIDTNTMENKDEAMDEAKPQLVRVKLEEARERFSKLANKAKKSSAFVNFGLTQLEWLSTPVVERVAKFGNPLIDQLDSKLDQAYVTINDKVVDPAIKLHSALDLNQDGKVGVDDVQIAIQQYILVPSTWFSKVDAVLVSSSTQLKSAFAKFHQSCVEQWNKLDVNMDSKVSREEFIDSIKQRLSKVWDESLVPVVEAFYSEARDNLKGLSTVEQREKMFRQIQARLSAIWQDRILATFNNKVAGPAHLLFASALDYYMSMDLKSLSSETTQAFIAGMKDRLGTSWTESLEPLMAEFYDGARSAAIEDLQALHNRFDYNHDGVLSVGDFLATGKSVASAIGLVARGTVHTVWQRVLSYSKDQVDKWLPQEDEDDSTAAATTEEEPEESEEKSKADADLVGNASLSQKYQAPLSISEIGSSVSRRLRTRAVSSLSKVREFSAVRLKNIIHVDLISYAEQVIEDASNQAKPRYEQVQSQLEQAVLRVNDVIDTAQTSISPQLEALNNKAHDVKESVTPYTKELRAKLAVAIERVRALSNRSENWFLNRQISKLPSDVIKFLTLIPQILLGKSYSESEYAQTFQLMQDLVSSVKDLFFWSGQSTDGIEPPSPTPVNDSSDQKKEGHDFEPEIPAQASDVDLPISGPENDEDLNDQVTDDEEDGSSSSCPDAEDPPSSEE